MIGRSGRRGLDIEGNIVYVNVKWKNLMKGKLNNIVGKKSRNNHYFSLEKISNINNNDIKNTFKNFLNKDKNYYNTKKLINDINYFDNNYEYLLIWKLKEYKYIIYFVKILDKLTLIFKKNNMNINDELYILNIMIEIFINNNPINIDNIEVESNEILNLYKLKNIKVNKQINKDIYIELGNIIKTIYNILIEYNEFRYFNNLIYTLFINIRNMVNNIDFLNN